MRNASRAQRLFSLNLKVSQFILLTIYCFIPSSTYASEEWRSKLPAGLQPHFEIFVNAPKAAGCDIEPRFLAAIAMFESGGGTSESSRDSRKEIMGRMDGKGKVMAAGSIKNSVERMATEICKSDGYYKGRKTIEEIAEVYSPPCAPNDKKGTNKDWPKYVRINFEKLGGSGPVVNGNGSSKSEARNYCGKSSKRSLSEKSKRQSNKVYYSAQKKGSRKSEKSRFAAAQ
jgi:hypothetical protein